MRIISYDCVVMSLCVIICRAYILVEYLLHSNRIFIYFWLINDYEYDFEIDYLKNHLFASAQSSNQMFSARLSGIYFEIQINHSKLYKILHHISDVKQSMWRNTVCFVWLLLVFFCFKVKPKPIRSTFENISSVIGHCPWAFFLLYRWNRKHTKPTKMAKTIEKIAKRTTG